MNTYKKFCANVFIAKCDTEHAKGDIIEVTTKYSDIHECEIHNLVKKDNDSFYYSITRLDGFNSQERAKNKIDKLNRYADNADKKSLEYHKRSNKDKEFLSLGEPIKVGHHSEKRHRKIIAEANNNISKQLEASNKAKEYRGRTGYWEEKSKIVNLSMPESIEYFKKKYETAEQYHKGLKDGSIEKSHSYSVAYANKNKKELKKKYELAVLLWS